jgi:hypothetical protein
VPWHQVWHVAVLGTTLLAAAGVVIVWLGPAILEARSGVTARGVRLVLGLVVLAIVLLATEWLVVHGRFL